VIGWLRGVGVGPGDPGLVTVKAARLIGEADVVAFHSGPRGDSIARRIAASYLREGVVEELLVYPVTTLATFALSRQWAFSTYGRAGRWPA